MADRVNHRTFGKFQAAGIELVGLLVNAVGLSENPIGDGITGACFTAAGVEWSVVCEDAIGAGVGKIEVACRIECHSDGTTHRIRTRIAQETVVRSIDLTSAMSEIWSSDHVVRY